MVHGCGLATRIRLCTCKSVSVRIPMCRIRVCVTRAFSRAPPQRFRRLPKFCSIIHKRALVLSRAPPFHRHRHSIFLIYLSSNPLVVLDPGTHYHHSSVAVAGFPLPYRASNKYTHQRVKPGNGTSEDTKHPSTACACNTSGL